MRIHMDFDHPFTFISYANLTLSYFPDWAVRRALAKLVKDGVLMGPVPVPKTRKGEAVWYRCVIGARESGWLTWAEGHWRRWHTNLSQRWLVRMAKRERNEAARRARPRMVADTARWDRKKHPRMPPMKTVPGSRPPSTSKTASLREFMRAMPTVQWDGMAYYPLAGAPMDELLAWRSSLPRAEVDQPPSYRTRPSSRKPKSAKCPRCGNVFQCSVGRLKIVHRKAECNVLIVTRVMEE